jgi:hypothetical protein
MGQEQEFGHEIKKDQIEVFFNQNHMKTQVWGVIKTLGRANTNLY